MLRMVVIYALTLLLPVSSRAQTYLTEHYTIKDGLPSNAMRSINEDEDGNIWLVTDNGIAMYNGNFFRTFNSLDKLKIKAVFDIFPSTGGKVYLIDYLKGMDYLYHDSLFSLNTGNVHIRTPYESMGKVYGSDQDQNMYVFGKDSVMKLVDAVPPGLLDRLPKNEHLYIAYPYVFVIQGNKVTAVNVKTSESVTNTCPGDVLTLDNASRHMLYERLYFVDKTQAIVCYDPSRNRFTHQSLRNRNTIAYKGKQLIFSKGTLQMTTENGLIVMDTNLRQIDSLRIDVAKEGIISMFRDRQKNIWLLTNNGLKQISSYFRKMKVLPNSSVKKMAYFGHLLYVVREDGNVTAYDTLMRPVREIPISDIIKASISPVFYKILETQDSIVIATNKNITVIKRNGDVYSMRPSKTASYLLPSMKDILYRKGDLNILNFEGLCQFDIVSNIIEFNPIGRFNRIYSDNNDSLIVLDGNNIYILRNEKIFPYKNQLFDAISSATGFAVPDFLAIDDDTWIAAFDNNIFSFNTHTNKLVSFSVKDKVVFFKKEKSHLWVGTMSMLYRYSTNDGGEYQLEEQYFNFSFRIYQNLLDIVTVGERVFLASNYGITELPLNNDRSTHDISLGNNAISSVKYGKQIRYTDHDSSITLQYERSNISIHFSSNTTGLDKDIAYMSYIEGIDEQWQSSNTHIVTYPALRPGTYKLHYYSSLPKYSLSSKKQTITITIAPLWWQHQAFKGVVIIAGVLVAGFIVIRISLNRKNKLLQRALLEKNIANVRLSALQSQMNPHFVFNAMASIQSFLKQKKNELAEESLTEFATLIRSYLEFSSKQFITLAEEVRTLKIYTSIEKKRFDGKFDVEFDIETEKRTDDILIPPLIIQPFVENAIVHGLYHKLNGKGRLRVSFKEKDGILSIIVDDNGIGRQAANKLNRAMGRSNPKGVQLTYERINLLNTSEIINININTTDKTDPQGKPDGVLVTINIKNENQL